jgi:hypothetical protein
MADSTDIFFEELGKQFNITLNADEKLACAILYQGKITVQIQKSPRSDEYFFISRISDITPGAYRTEILKQALKANGGSEYKIGYFAFLPSSSSLVLFQAYPQDFLTKEKILPIFISFAEMALSWNQSLLLNQSPPI